MRELYEQELSYFAELSSAEGSIQGRLNRHTEPGGELSVYRGCGGCRRWGTPTTRPSRIWPLPPWTRPTGRRSAPALNREKVLADYAAGKTDYHLDFLRRRNGGGAFWGQHQLPPLLKSGEQATLSCSSTPLTSPNRRLREQLLMQDRGAGLRRDHGDQHPRGIHRMISFDKQTEDTDLPAGRYSRRRSARIAERFMDEARQSRNISRKLDYDYMQETAGASSTSYTFMRGDARQQTASCGSSGSRYSTSTGS